MITVQLDTYSLYDLEGNMLDIISRLQKIRSSIPKEFRDTAEISIDQNCWYQYDSAPHTEVKITYKRPETKKEMAVILQRENEKQNSIIEKERQLLQDLKKKYELT